METTGETHSTVVLHTSFLHGTTKCCALEFVGLGRLCDVNRSKSVWPLRWRCVGSMSVALQLPFSVSFTTEAQRPSVAVAVPSHLLQKTPSLL